MHTTESVQQRTSAEVGSPEPLPPKESTILARIEGTREVEREKLEPFIAPNGENFISYDDYRAWEHMD